MAEFFGTTLDDIFDTMPARFIPEKAEGLDMTIGYKCGSESQWKLVVKNKEMKINKVDGELKGCDVVIAGSDEQTVLGVYLGKINPMDAISSGKLKVDGNLKLVSLLAKIFVPYSVPGGVKKEAEELLSMQVINSIGQRFASGPVMGMWYAGLEERKFLGNKCPKCGRTQIPPREVCAYCRVRVTEYIELGPKATVTNFERVYFASPDPLTGIVRETPYMVVFIVLDGASEQEAFSHEFVDKKNYDKVKIGSRVRPVWADSAAGSFGGFRGYELDE